MSIETIAARNQTIGELREQIERLELDLELAKHDYRRMVEENAKHWRWDVRRVLAKAGVVFFRGVRITHLEESELEELEAWLHDTMKRGLVQ